MPKMLRSRGQRALVEVLIEVREKAGLTQRALAARLKRPRSYVSKIEGGERRIDPVECVEWAKSCDTTPQAFFGRFTRRLSVR
jgi:transcriptional regulator with XRE-family HTH domain